MKQDKLRIISAKDLGKLALSEFCPRCFWIERHYGTPPSLFPSIFSIIDSVTKKRVHQTFSSEKRLPDWLNISNVVDVVEGDIMFKLPVEWGNWVLSGRPDDIFYLSDESYHIADYKTAKFTGRQDELFPMYEIQLNCYAYLAEKYGFKPVSQISLIYCQPNEDLDRSKDFKLGFETNYLEIKIDFEKVSKLLIQAREIVESSQLPEAKRECKGICRWLDNLI